MALERIPDTPDEKVTAWTKLLSEPQASIPESTNSTSTGLFVNIQKLSNFHQRPRFWDGVVMYAAKRAYRDRFQRLSHS